ncbi:hypothetical protein SAMN04488023_11681 [Pedobacter rhizosphaerae]|uniref:Uncharacterized protein n=1 Tax=Pedobacter rhizosphaerae TaxID=390241 RepID=A0A1H9S335_9SPHI|nr:hypothetical protein SAMN04488023_11681 [Pedobacter rhizosphaerae]
MRRSMQIFREAGYKIRLFQIMSEALKNRPESTRKKKALRSRSQGYHFYKEINYLSFLFPPPKTEK